MKKMNLIFGIIVLLAILLVIFFIVLQDTPGFAATNFHSNIYEVPGKVIDAIYETYTGI